MEAEFMGHHSGLVIIQRFYYVLSDQRLMHPHMLLTVIVNVKN